MLEGGWAKLPQGNVWKLPDRSPIHDDCRKSAGLEAKASRYEWAAISSSLQ